MLPLLQTIFDGHEHNMATITEKLATQFKLSKEERKELLPSGTSFKFASRVSWARTYMGKANLLVKTSRGVIKITDRGKALLVENPPAINNALLIRYPEFLEFKQKGKEEASSQVAEPIDSEPITPEEKLGRVITEFQTDLKGEVLNAVLAQSPAFFEKLVIELLVKMGYGGTFEDAAKVLGKSGDAGLDGVIKEDRLGLDVLYVQAKKWDIENPVGRKEIQSFVGALAGAGATKGIFVTTSKFTKEASTYKPNNLRVILIDGDQLADLMIAYNVGVQIKDTVLIKKVDQDYFTIS